MTTYTVQLVCGKPRHVEGASSRIWSGRLDDPHATQSGSRRPRDSCWGDATKPRIKRFLFSFFIHPSFPSSPPLSLPCLSWASRERHLGGHLECFLSCNFPFRFAVRFPFTFFLFLVHYYVFFPTFIFLTQTIFPPTIASRNPVMFSGRKRREIFSLFLTFSVPTYTTYRNESRKS